MSQYQWKINLYITNTGIIHMIKDMQKKSKNFTTGLLSVDD